MENETASLTTDQLKNLSLAIAGASLVISQLSATDHAQRKALDLLMSRLDSASSDVSDAIANLSA